MNKLTKIKKLLDKYPSCWNCRFAVYVDDVEKKCELPIYDRSVFSDCTISCPKDKVVLEIMKVLKECDEHEA